jgi:hypothetical protein
VTGTQQAVETENLGTFGEVSAGVNYIKILEGGSAGNPRELTATLRGDFKFSDQLLAGGLTASLRLQF